MGGTYLFLELGDETKGEGEGEEDEEIAQVGGAGEEVGGWVGGWGSGRGEGGLNEMLDSMGGWVSGWWVGGVYL